ncbi:MAG: glutamine--tRNA ligase/YqeY domain fusion protein [Kofleriaceae bacterium]
MSGPTAPARPRDFLRELIDRDLADGRHHRVATRFPPEPNGYLHIGHAKSICLNFGLAAEYAGRGIAATCNLRFDDTNPVKEDVEYVESIEADVRWLGFAPTAVLYAADYFGEMHARAVALVDDGRAYVCECTEDQIRAGRGTLSEPGTPCVHRGRTAADNRARFEQMKAGALADGAAVLRAKIDLAAANMKLRDPLLYRIRHAHHHRTGDAWCIYPMYDFAHPIEDELEGITHSICTLEFENNRDLYDWVIEHTRRTQAFAAEPAPRQYEFARLALEYTVMSKRKLLTLVEGGHVSGWDDPRMPTIAGLRRRGIRPEAIRAFCELVGVAKTNSMVDYGKLEYCVRDDLNAVAPRRLAVLRPVALEISNWDELGVGAEERLEVPSFPSELATAGSRAVPLTRELFVERDDVWAGDDAPPRDFQRLAVGRTVRLRGAFAVTCDAIDRDAGGAVTRVRVTAHPESRGGGKVADGRKLGSALHWVSAERSVVAEVRLYDRLFAVARPEDGGDDFLRHLNPASLEVITDARIEPALADAAPGERFQFERTGYFVADAVDHRPGARPVFGRIIGLRDAWAEATKASPPPRDAAAKPKQNAKAATRPDSKSPAEFRAEARRRDATLQATYDRALTLGLTEGDADLLSGDVDTAALWETCADAGVAATGARWIINELPRALAEYAKAGGDGSLSGQRDNLAAALPELAHMLDSGEATAAQGKWLLVKALEFPGEAPRALAKRFGLPAAIDVAALDAIIDTVLAANVDKVTAYRGGKLGLLGFFVGQVVKASAGAADPTIATERLRLRLDA